MFGESVGKHHVFSGDCSGVFFRTTACWVWCLTCQTQKQMQPNSTSGKLVAFMLKRYTAAKRPDRHVTVWLRLRYKHRWASKRTAPHVPHVTMQACVKEAIGSARYSMSTSTHCTSMHLCESVFLWGHEQGCSPPQTSPFLLLCLPHDQSPCRATAPFDAPAQ